ncbi:MAG TPA: hypothetical protein DEQ45_03635 [Agrobacterium sp.]|nr:hypothetical protein [Agrobacterium sp.]
MICGRKSTIIDKGYLSAVSRRGHICERYGTVTGIWLSLNESFTINSMSYDLTKLPIQSLLRPMSEAGVWLLAPDFN